MLVLDTSGLLAAIGPDQPHHKEARRVLESERGPLLLSPFVLAETDYMVLTRVGVHRELEFLRDIGEGGYELVGMSSHDVSRAADLVARYAGMKVGITDASVALVAARHRTTRVLTLDHRHFRTMKPLWGDTFTVLPADDG
ncbi:PIN domain-containing protein [Nonomuraea indica]|uniref:PIN domain-containing protein n=1 Tax=Nonomuraea indica TaxID=1581193 RepID=UPI000C7E0700|nr:PIN domain-containing protein [Nonomuraea indica]